MRQLSRIPVFLLTGFLGSGKTTLLNRLMGARPESWGKLAIVVNELGEVGIDGDLLPSGMTRQVELPGGCICCVLNEDLDKTLSSLLDGTPDLETIIIETTGVAEPAPITWSLGREPLSQRIRLAAVITVVDPLNFEQSRPLGRAVDEQVEYADILVVSKLDLADSAELPEPFLATLRQLNPAAALIAGSPDQVVSVLWRSLSDPALSPSERGTESQAPGKAALAHGRRGHGEHDHEHGGEHDHEREPGHAPGPAGGVAHGFDTVWLAIEHVIDFEELSDRLEELPGNYVRIKGIARMVDASSGSSTPRWMAFHRVGTRISCEPLSAPSESRMVALGPGIERARLAACLEAAVVPCEG